MESIVFVWRYCWGYNTIYWIKCELSKGGITSNNKYKISKGLFLENEWSNIHRIETIGIKPWINKQLLDNYKHMNYASKYKQIRSQVRYHNFFWKFWKFWQFWIFWKFWRFFQWNFLSCPYSPYMWDKYEQSFFIKNKE